MGKTFGPFETYTETTHGGVTFGLHEGQVATFNEDDNDFVVSGAPDPDTTLTATNESNEAALSVVTEVVVEPEPEPEKAPAPKKKAAAKPKK